MLEPRRRHPEKGPPRPTDVIEILDQPTYIEPSFDLKALKKLLTDVNATEKSKIAGLLGLHLKFWHATVPDMQRMLYRGGFGKDVLELLPRVLQSCADCLEWASKLTRPVMKAKFAEHFNQRVQTDLFFLWDPPRTYIMLIDECIRYCVTAYLETKTAEEWMRVVLRVWIRYFGPMRCIATDQEGAITADLVAVACEKFAEDRKGTRQHQSPNGDLPSSSLEPLNCGTLLSEPDSEQHKTIVSKRSPWPRTSCAPTAALRQRKH